MTRKELDELQKVVEAQTVRARSLGGYSTEAESMMVMWEVLLKLVRHVAEKSK